MISVSEDFNDAEQADVNKPTAKAFLILGNYATAAFGASVAASGAAANYPAAGAIDGDRTELNVGAASGADNDVGQGSWRSAVAPSVTPQTLTINMGQSRTVNRIKLYHLSSHAMSSYKIESSPDDVTYTLVAKTTDQGGTIATSHEVDTVDFDDTACRYLKLTVADTVVAADKANVVEFEIYRLVDISDRIMSCKTSRARDYQLKNSMAATASLTLSNTDKFFSPSYTPTSLQTDFVNSELKPGVGLLVQFGFDTEYVDQFIGTIDRFTIKPLARTCSIEARDAMKGMFNKVVATKLKSNQDLGAIVTYMLNKANISTWETDVDTTGITIDYFFTFDQSIIETMNTLLEAAGDGTFFLTESGIATFRSYLRSTALSHTDTSEADFEAGTLTNIDTTSEPGKLKLKWFLLENFSDGNFSSNPTWTASALNSGGGSFANNWAISSGAVDANVSSASIGFLSCEFLTTPFTAVTGSWEYKCKSSVFTTNGCNSTFAFMATGSLAKFGLVNSSYSLTIRPGALSVLARISGGSSTTIGSFAGVPNDGAFHTVRITRSFAGEIKVYFDGVLKITGTDTAFTTSSYIALVANNGNTEANQHIAFDDIYYSPVVEASEAVATQGVFVSQTIDQTVSIATESIFQTTQITPTGTTITWYTATSADGLSWDAYVAVTPGGAIGSVARRYIRYKAVLDTTLFLVTPTITDDTVNWTVGTGSVKYPATVSYTFDETLNIDLDQIYADTVAGGTSIINSVSVKAQPLVLAGLDADVQWQGTTGTPPVPISASDPLGVTNGQTLTYPIVVSGGMDISRMSGANPLAAAITFAGGGAGSWVFSSIHPTKPVLVITITGTGTITNLQVEGKAFTSDDTLLEATATDDDSIQEFGVRQQGITNTYIVNSATAQSIADRIIENLSEPTTYTPQLKVRPTFSIQIGDRITLSDEQLDIHEDNLVIGVEHQMSATLGGGDVYSILKLLKIPT